MKGIPWWNQCWLNLGDSRPIIVINHAELRPGSYLEITSDAFQGEFDRACFELMNEEEKANFNTVDWGLAKCLMQDINFEIAMAEFKAATEQYA